MNTQDANITNLSPPIGTAPPNWLRLRGVLDVHKKRDGTDGTDRTGLTKRNKKY